MKAERINNSLVSLCYSHPNCFMPLNGLLTNLSAYFFALIMDGCNENRQRTFLDGLTEILGPNNRNYHIPFHKYPARSCSDLVPRFLIAINKERLNLIVLSCLQINIVLQLLLNWTIMWRPKSVTSRPFWMIACNFQVWTRESTHSEVRLQKAGFK